MKPYFLEKSLTDSGVSRNSYHDSRTLKALGGVFVVGAAGVRVGVFPLTRPISLLKIRSANFSAVKSKTLSKNSGELFKVSPYSISSNSSTGSSDLSTISDSSSVIGAGSI